MKIIFCIWILIISCDVSSEIYSWRDEKGKMHFGERPPGKEANVSVEKIIVETVNASEAIKVTPYGKSRQKMYPLKNNVSKQKLVNKTDLGTQQKYDCSAAKNYYREITTFTRTGASKSVVVLYQEDGTMMSRREQDNHAEQYREEANSRGCKIKKGKGLRSSK